MTGERDLAERIEWLEVAVERIATMSSPPITLPPRPASGGLTFASDAAATGDVSADVRALLAEGKTIEAIKRYREETGSSLGDAKDAIDRL